MRAKNAPHDTEYPYRTPDALEQEAIDNSYKFLGWQVHGEPLQPCLDARHNHTSEPQGWRTSQNNSRGSDVTYVCDGHKIFWKIDMSD